MRREWDVSRMGTSTHLQKAGALQILYKIATVTQKYLKESPWTLFGFKFILFPSDSPVAAASRSLRRERRQPGRVSRCSRQGGFRSWASVLLVDHLFFCHVSEMSFHLSVLIFFTTILQACIASGLGNHRFLKITYLGSTECQGLPTTISINTTALGVRY